MSSNMKKATLPQAKSRFQRETLVSDSATLESLFRSNWPLRRSEAALNCEPDNLRSYRYSTINLGCLANIFLDTQLPIWHVKQFTIGLGGRISQIRKKTTRFSSSLNALFPPANVNRNTIPLKN